MDNNIEKTINEIKGIAGTVNIKVLSNPYTINDDVVLGAEHEKGRFW